MNTDGIQTSYKKVFEISDADDWMESLQFEIHTLNRINTWKLIEISDGRQIIKKKWVFDLIKNGKPEVIRKKEILVAKGISKVPVVDFTEGFLPVMKYSKFLPLFELVSVKFGWCKSLIDLKNSFFNPPINEEIFVEQPKIFSMEGCEDHMYRS